MKRSPIRKVSPKQRQLIIRDVLFRDQIMKRDERCVVSGFGECDGPLDCCHVLPKGRRPDLRYEPWNVFIACRRHHRWAHREPIGFRSWFRERYPERAMFLNL